MLTPVRRGRGVDAALAVGSMHPHVLDAELDALSHRALRLVGRRGDDDGIHSSRDATQIVITAGTLNLVCIWVDREHLVTPIPQTLEHGIGSVLLGFSRHTCHSDSLMSKKLRSGFLHRWHSPPPSRFSNRNDLRGEHHLGKQDADERPKKQRASFANCEGDVDDQEAKASDISNGSMALMGPPYPQTPLAWSFLRLGGILAQ